MANRARLLLLTAMKRWFWFPLVFVLAGMAGVLWLDAPSRGVVPRPEFLKTRNPPTTAFIEIRRAQAKARRRSYATVQRWTSLSRISTPLQRSVLAAEDSGFYGHHGVEWSLVRNAVRDNWRAGKPVRGASTITQQLAKNLYLSPHKSYARKFRELIYTWRLERALSKRRILELYLNIVEWGDGLFGVEAAAQVYFGKSAADLDWNESVALAAALPSPRRHHPGDGSPWMERRMEAVRDRLRVSGLGEE